MVLNDEYIIGTAKELYRYIENHEEEELLDDMEYLLHEIVAYKDDVVLYIDDMNGMGLRVMEYDGEQL